MTAPIRQPNLFLIVLPLIAGVLLIDQITKFIAIDTLCLLADATSCSSLTGIPLDQAPIVHQPARSTFFPLIDLQFSLNPNAALSMPIPGPEWFEHVLLLSIMAVLAGWLWREGGRNNALGVGLILGGALGNYADRLMHGAVVDFLVPNLGFSPFIFNVADSAITVGVIWLFIEQLALKPRRQAEAVVS